MGDAIKIAVKTGLIAVIMAGVIALFANIQIPSLNYTQFSQAISTGLAVMFHWVPIMSVLWPIVLFLLAFHLGYYTFRIAMIAIKWVMKVNE